MNAFTCWQIHAKKSDPESGPELDKSPFISGVVCCCPISNTKQAPLIHVAYGRDHHHGRHHGHLHGDHHGHGHGHPFRDHGFENGRDHAHHHGGLCPYPWPPSPSPSSLRVPSLQSPFGVPSLQPAASSSFWRVCPDGQDHVHLRAAVATSPRQCGPSLRQP